jgi:predicted MFS family arabinose efflux permease
LILYLVVLPTILLHLAFAGCRVNLSLFALSLNATPLTVGVVVSLLALLPMAFAVSAGRVMDRIGVRRPMLLGACATIAGLVLVFAVPRIEVLFIASPLVGSGFMLYHMAVNHAVGTMGAPEDRVRNFSMLALTFSTANFLGPMLTGFSIDWIGHRQTFLLLAGSASMALIVLLLKRLEVARHKQADAPGKERRMVDLWRDRNMRRVFFVSGTLSMAWDLFTFVVPIYGSQIGLSASKIGLILGAFGAAIFIVRLALPLFVHRVSEWRLLIVAMMTTGAGFFVFPLVTTVPVLIAFAFILGVGLGGTQPMIMSLLYAHAPPGHGGEAIGVRTLLLNFSQAGIPLLFGALGAALGIAPAFWAMAVVLAGGGYVLRKS